MTIEYPLVLNIGAQSISLTAREYSVLPLPGPKTAVAAVLPEQSGSMRPGLYLLTDKQWAYVLPYTVLNSSRFVDKVISVYCNLLNPTVLDADTDAEIYFNGGQSLSRTIPALDLNFWVAVSLRAPSSSSGSNYVLPRATATVLGGIQVIANSGLELYNGFLSVVKPNPVYQAHLPAQKTTQEAAGGVRYEWLIDVGAVRLQNLSACKFTTRTAPLVQVAFSVTKNGVPIGQVVFDPGSTIGTEVPNSATVTFFDFGDVLGFWQSGAIQQPDGSVQLMDSMNVFIPMERIG